MDIIKLSTDWAKAEVFSAKMVGLLSLVVIVTAVGFYYWGKTAYAKAFVIPMMVAGLFLVATSAGLYWANQPRIAQFEKEYKENPTEFVQKEIQRTTKSDNDLKLVFKVLPLIAIVGALLVYFLPMPVWRAIGIVLILLSALLMLIDANTSARNAEYRENLLNKIQ